MKKIWEFSLTFSKTLLRQNANVIRHWNIVNMLNKMQRYSISIWNTQHISPVVGSGKFCAHKLCIDWVMPVKAKGVGIYQQEAPLPQRAQRVRRA